jgi:hypothetical protein
VQLPANLGFCQIALNKNTKHIKMIDDYGNLWFCTLVYEDNNFKLGGGWKRMVVARRFRQGLRVIVGAPEAGSLCVDGVLSKFMSCFGVMF